MNEGAAAGGLGRVPRAVDVDRVGLARMVFAIVGAGEPGRQDHGVRGEVADGFLNGAAVAEIRVASRKASGLMAWQRVEEQPAKMSGGAEKQDSHVTSGSPCTTRSFRSDRA